MGIYKKEALIAASITAVCVIGFCVAANWIGEVQSVFYAGAAFVLVVGAWAVSKALKTDREIKEKVEADKRARANFREKALSGKADFSEIDFYKLCREANISSLDSKYSLAKAKAIAEQLLGKSELRLTPYDITPFPEDAIPLYTTTEKLNEFFDRGKAAVEQIERKKEESDKKPRKATLSDEQTSILALNLRLKDKTGREKRYTMLDEIIRKYTDKIIAIRRAQESIQKLGMIMASSVSQQKTAHWATVAGIADGLAGPVAGVLAGADAMSRNAQIEAKNRANREAVNHAAAELITGSYSLDKDVDSLQKECEVFKKAKEDLGAKVVFGDIDTEELFRSLRLSNAKITKTQNGVLNIEVNLSSIYVPEGIPEEVRTTIDGTLTGIITANGTTVGSVILPLPLYGVECSSSIATTAETICEWYIKSDSTYEVTFTPNKLWVMEI